VSRAVAVDGPPCGNGGVYVRADKAVSWAQLVTRRRFVRAECDAPDDPADEDLATDEIDTEVGCIAAGPSLPIGLAIVGLVLRSRRRRKT
jgi:hypothetical protein